MSHAKRILFLVAIAATFFYIGSKVRAKSTPNPSIAKFNSVTVKKPPAFAPAGSVPVADGTGLAAWAKVKGTALDSTPASAGMVLQADGSGGAAWASLIPPSPRATFLQAYYKTGNGTATISSPSLTASPQF